MMDGSNPWVIFADIGDGFTKQVEFGHEALVRGYLEETDSYRGMTAVFYHGKRIEHYSRGDKVV